MTTETNENEKLTAIPHPTEVAGMILNILAELDEAKAKAKADVANLRKQLRFSCEYHGVPYVDPSVKKKASDAITS